jgi:hypothetical protein
MQPFSNPFAINVIELREAPQRSMENLEHVHSAENRYQNFERARVSNKSASQIRHSTYSELFSCRTNPRRPIKAKKPKQALGLEADLYVEFEGSHNVKRAHTV